MIYEGEEFTTWQGFPGFDETKPEWFTYGCEVSLKDFIEELSAIYASLSEEQKKRAIFEQTTGSEEDTGGMRIYLRDDK